MDWTVFVVFIGLLSVPSIKCGIITLEEINEKDAATLIPSLTDSTNTNKEADQSTTVSTTFVEEDNKNTTSENVVEEANKNTTSENVVEEANKNTTSEKSGDIDVYYGFQASPVLVKVLGQDGKFHWYLTKEGVGDTHKKYYQYGLNYPQGYFPPYDYGSSSNLYNSFPLLEGHMFNKYPWSHPVNYYVTQGMNSPLTNVYPPYLPYPWNTAVPHLYNVLNHGLPSWYYQKPSPNPYFSNRYSEIVPYLNALLTNPSPIMNYLNSINPSHINPYDTASIFNQFPNMYQQSVYPSLNNYYTNPSPIMNYLNSINPSHINPYDTAPIFNQFPNMYPQPISNLNNYYHQFINEQQFQRNPYSFMTQFPYWYGLDNPIFQNQYNLLNNIVGYDQFAPRAHSLFPVKSYRSPYAPNYDFKPTNMRQMYTSTNYIPSTPNQLFWKMSHYKPPIQYNSDYFLCQSPNITPFLATSYDYINRLPLDPIYRLFFKVLITSLANLYPRNAYFDEPVYPYGYPYHYNV